MGLRSKMRVDDDEAMRKACFDGLRKIGDFVLDSGTVLRELKVELDLAAEVETLPQGL